MARLMSCIVSIINFKVSFFSFSFCIFFFFFSLLNWVNTNYYCNTKCDLKLLWKMFFFSICTKRKKNDLNRIWFCCHKFVYQQKKRIEGKSSLVCILDGFFLCQFIRSKNCDRFSILWLVLWMVKTMLLKIAQTLLGCSSNVISSPNWLPLFLAAQYLGKITKEIMKLMNKMKE